MSKDFKNDVTFLDPENKAFDRVIYHKEKPLSHAELGLMQDLEGDARAKSVRQVFPSGFLTGDFFDDDMTDYVFGTEPNTFELHGTPVVNVNGWIIPLEYTATDQAGVNVIELDDTSELSTGEYAIDFVYLEVWKAVVKADPSEDNKPASNKVYPHGNVLAPSATWLDDDLKDTPVHVEFGDETTSRVQLQYAIRSSRLQNNTDRIGYTDINVEAQGPNAGPTGYSFERHDSDPGLWVAGDGDPENMLSTVDGYVYSVPLVWAYRRNEQGFSPTANGYGSSTFAQGSNDRPDGLFADQIASQDVQDMRMASVRGVDYTRLLQKNASLLMDNQLQAWAQQGNDASWTIAQESSVGTKVLMADDLIQTTTGANNSGNEFRHPDGICTVFSDRSHLERHLEVFDEPGNGTEWQADEELVFDLNSGGLDLFDEQPLQTAIVDMVSIHFNAWDPDNAERWRVDVDNVELTNDNRTLTITLDEPPSGITDEDIWVELEIEYPTGSGLTALFEEEPDNFSAWAHDLNNWDGISTQQQLRDHLEINFTEGPQREVEVLHHPVDPTTEETEVIEENGDYVVYTTKPIYDVEEVRVNGTPEAVESFERRRIVLEDPQGPGDPVETDYFPYLPVQRDQELTLYYMTPALQAIPDQYLQENTELELLAVPNTLYTTTASSGSHITPFPYEAASNQIPVADPVGQSPVYEGEHELSAPGTTSVNGFDATVGQLSLSTLVPFVPVDSLTLINKQEADADDHAHPVDHFMEVADDYAPSAFAQSLSSSVEHKVFMPVLARLQHDTEWATEGTTVLVVFTQYFNSASETEDSEQNSFSMSDSNACAAVYKVKGNVLSYD